MVNVNLNHSNQNFDLNEKAREFFSNRNLLYIVFIFLFILGFRLYFTFTNPNFSEPSAYTNLRYISYILDHFKPLIYDTLSYSGKSIISPPFFYYFMAILSFGNIFLLKLIPELLFAFTAVLVYLIAKEVSENQNYAFFAALITGFIPVYLSRTINQISILSLIIPLLLFMLLCTLNLDKKFYFWGFIVCSFLLPLISPLSLLFVLTMISYLFLLGGGFLTPSKLKKEAILASSLLISLITLIFFKKPLFEYGFSLIWQNTPINILTDNYRQLNFLDALFQIGVLPLIFGSLGIFYGINKEKKKSVYLFSGLMFSVLLLLSLRLITLLEGLVFVGLSLGIFSSLGFKALFSYFQKTKAINLSKVLAIIMLGLVFIFSIFPAKNYIIDNQIDENVIKDMLWAKENLEVNSVVAGNVYEGELISGVASLKNVADVNFVLAPKTSERMQDLTVLYSTPWEVKANEIIKKYNIKAIYFSAQTKALFNIDELKYAVNNKCFKKEGNFYVTQC